MNFEKFVSCLTQEEKILIIKILEIDIKENAKTESKISVWDFVNGDCVSVRLRNVLLNNFDHSTDINTISNKDIIKCLNAGKKTVLDFNFSKQYSTPMADELKTLKISEL